MEGVIFEFYRGDTYTRDFTISGYESSIDNVYFTVKESEQDKFSVISKKLNDGITVVDKDENSTTFNLLIKSIDTNNLKTTNKRGGVAKIKTIPNGKIKVSVQTNRKPEKFIKEYSATGFDFNNVDFSNFAFTTKDMSYIVYKIKMKKFIDLTLKFYSEDRPFGLYDATLEVFQGSYIKRT